MMTKSQCGLEPSIRSNGSVPKNFPSTFIGVPLLSSRAPSNWGCPRGEINELAPTIRTFFRLEVLSAPSSGAGATLLLGAPSGLRSIEG